MLEKNKLNQNLFKDIKQLIYLSKQKVLTTINSEISLLYYEIGKKINKEILKYKRAEYGKKVIKELSKDLTKDYGTGWSEKHLRHCLRTAETFKNEKIFYALSRKLSWTHIRTCKNEKNHVY
jgi:hypothetical protein